VSLLGDAGGTNATVKTGHGRFLFPGIVGGWFSAVQADDLAKLRRLQAHGLRLHEDTAAFVAFGSDAKVVEFLVADGDGVLQAVNRFEEAGTLFVYVHITYGNADAANDD